MRTLETIVNTDSPSSSEQQIQHLAKCSGYAARSLAKNPELINELISDGDEPFTRELMRTTLSNVPADSEATLKQTLRKLRQRVMLRIMFRDLNGLCDLQEVMLTMSALAEVAVEYVLAYWRQQWMPNYGLPMNAQEEEQALIVIGMGKLGGVELNVSSDIDLIFAYEQEGFTNGPEVLSNQDYFIRLAKKLISALDDITEDGFVFRVDMRLRPFGSEGVLVSSVDGLEDYYQNHGREWERYAWIKGRVIHGPDGMIRRVLMPFVFRKYLDYGAFASMRDLKIQIEREVNRKDMHDNIKLGRGGIREVEFIAQVFQLIRGGQDVALQIRPTMAVLDALGERNLLPAHAVEELKASYIFLRDLEHRLQYLEDQQTQTLPTQSETRDRLVLAMRETNWQSLSAQIELHRTRVDMHFSQVFNSTKVESGQHSMAQVWLGTLEDSASITMLRNARFQNPEEVLRLSRNLLHSKRYKQLPEASRQRLDRVMPAVFQESAKQPHPDHTFMRLTDFMESICRRASYLALLVEYPDALHLLAKLASASPWLMQYLQQHPLLLDELLDPQQLYSVTDFTWLQRQLQLRLSSAEGDVERMMDTMRHFKHATLFRIAAQDIAGMLPLMDISDALSDLAELLLQASLNCVWPMVKGRHRDTPKFAVIGYGKLGGRELGYASDLDLIFLYDDDDASSAEVYARFAQRINHWFNTLTSAGMLYETDLQLRPDGNSGLLVSHVDAFARYQEEKAWLWEHQALTRARFVAGDKSIGLRFEAIRTAILRQTRDTQTLQKEIVTMRQKMKSSHPRKIGQFNVKHDDGGIIDIEFMVQYLVLREANRYPTLAENIGNVGLLKRCTELELIDRQLAYHVADTYVHLREIQHQQRLQGNIQGFIPNEQAESWTLPVKRLWKWLLNDRP